LLAVRVYFYLSKIEKIHKEKSMDEYQRAKGYFAERRKLVLFVLIVIAVALLAYLYYYEFLLCKLDYGYLWWFILLLILIPVLIYELMHFIEYKDREKLRKMGALHEEHAAAMERMLLLENQQIIELERRIAGMIAKISKDAKLHALFDKFPELRVIYKDIIKLYYEYQQNKNPYGIERELCKKVYDLETNEQFKQFAAQYPDIWMLFEQLKLLYQHYESKQQLYDEIDQERERIKQRAVSTDIDLGGDSNKFEGGGEDGGKGDDESGGEESKDGEKKE
jgi:hypothetical protein